MTKLRWFLILIFIGKMISSCSKTSADLIVQNGKIYTIDEGFNVYESIAIREGRILASGTNAEISAGYRAVRKVDLGGKYMYPGFNDAHAHFYGYGMNLMQYANLAGTGSQEEILSILKEHHRQTGSDWILGRGWDQNNWSEREFPDKSKLDEFFPDVPVCLIRIDGHAAWCNSKALSLAAVSDGFLVQGGEVLIRNGEPTGILIDNAMELVTRYITAPGPEMKANALIAAQAGCFKAGITSVTDCGLSRETVMLIDSLHKNGTLKMRINAMLDPTDENFEHFVRNGGYRSDRLMVNTIKIYADGALGSRGALLLEPYSDDPVNNGLQMASDRYFGEICSLAYENNFQVATHCIGDSANRLILNIYGKYLKGENDRRWRIEHAQVLHPDDFRLFQKYSVVPSIQATHATSDLGWATDRVGEDRIKDAYAYLLLLQQLGWLPNGTDFPVEEISPVNTFFASVFRTQHNGTPAGGFQMENALSREQALRSMTIWAARASFEENVKGSLEAGKWADFVVLDTDLMTASPQEVLETKILSTWIAGEKVF
jgi:predicted amidohydrolase YtcJ